jgi:hypothetical protein
MKRTIGTRDGGAVPNEALDHTAHPSQRRGSIRIVRGLHPLKPASNDLSLCTGLLHGASSLAARPRLAEIRCHITARSRSILAPSGNILSFARQVGLTCSPVGVSLADQIEDRTFSPNFAPALPGQSAPPVASMSRATAAVQDCSLEPSASPVNGSKYSAKPPSESSSRVSRRIL